MQVRVCFYSYFKDLAGRAETLETLPEGSRVSDLLEGLYRRFPRLEAMRQCTLVAVGVEYQDRNHALRDGNEVSLFPPVQGG
jgi:molybdopterin converting factor small subunit